MTIFSSGSTLSDCTANYRSLVTVREFFYAVAQACSALRVGECPLYRRFTAHSRRYRLKQNAEPAESRRERQRSCHANRLGVRMSGHRFQTQVTISVPPRCSASPRSSSSRKKRACMSTGRLRSRPHRTCSVGRVILHWCKIVTPPSKLGGGVCPAISAFSRATLSAREAVERSRSGPTGTPLGVANGRAAWANRISSLRAQLCSRGDLRLYRPGSRETASTPRFVAIQRSVVSSWLRVTRWTSSRFTISAVDSFLAMSNSLFP